MLLKKYYARKYLYQSSIRIGFDTNWFFNIEMLLIIILRSHSRRFLAMLGQASPAVSTVAVLLLVTAHKLKLNLYCRTIFVYLTRRSTADPIQAPGIARTFHMVSAPIDHAQHSRDITGMVRGTTVARRRAVLLATLTLEEVRKC